MQTRRPLVYQPLGDYLAASHRAEETLTFQRIEEILGRRLPPAARKHQAWWANDASHVQSKMWMSVGWKVDQVNQTTEYVTFRWMTAPGEPRSDSSQASTLGEPKPLGEKRMGDRTGAPYIRLIDDLRRADWTKLTEDQFPAYKTREFFEILNRLGVSPR